MLSLCQNQDTPKGKTFGGGGGGGGGDGGGEDECTREKNRSFNLL